MKADGQMKWMSGRSFLPKNLCLDNPSNIYVTRTTRANRVGLPHIFKNLVAFKKKIVTQGTLEWRMHDDRKMASMMWKDKKQVLLISTHARLVAFPCKIVEVPH
jgi:hypothetical protein